MPRTKPILPVEKLIGARLRELREGHLLTGTAFAKKYGINSGNLSKYENGWVPLPWEIGNRIAFVENVSQEWLATGALPRAPYLWFDEAVFKTIPRRSTFNFAYTNYLAPRFAGADKSFRKEGKKSKLPKAAYRDAWMLGEEYSIRDQLPMIIHLIETWYSNLPKEGRRGLIQSLDNTISEYVAKYLPSVDTSGVTVKAIDLYFKNRQHHRSRLSSDQTPPS